MKKSKKVKCVSVVLPANLKRFYVERGKDGVLTFIDNHTWMIVVEIDGTLYYFKFNVKAGYKTDGCSAPRLLKRWLPDWKGDSEYDVCALMHDILYGLSGFVGNLGFKLTADECDAIYRGALREAGIPRIIASGADFFLFAAHTKKHFGADQYKTNKLASVEVVGSN